MLRDVRWQVFIFRAHLSGVADEGGRTWWYLPIVANSHKFISVRQILSLQCGKMGIVP